MDNDKIECFFLKRRVYLDVYDKLVNVCIQNILCSLYYSAIFLHAGTQNENWYWVWHCIIFSRNFGRKRRLLSVFNVCPRLTRLCFCRVFFVALSARLFVTLRLFDECYYLYTYKCKYNYIKYCEVTPTDRPSVDFVPFGCPLSAAATKFCWWRTFCNFVKC